MLKDKCDEQYENIKSRPVGVDGDQDSSELVN